MRKIIVSLLLLLSIGFSKANPISLPPVISEFYLVSDSEWYLELYFDPAFYYDTILDGYQITTSTDTVLFKDGIHFTSGSILIITQDSLQSLLHIYRVGDMIRIEKTVPYNEWIDEITFGNFQYSEINAPLIGQSMVKHSYSCFDTYNMQNTIAYKLVKENTPSIGFNQFQANVFMGTFSGKILDMAHNPLSGVKVGNPASYYEPAGTCSVEFNCFTNTSGEFSALVKGGKQNVRIYNISSIFLDTIINVEPDSVNYYEINLDTLLNHTALNLFHQDFILSSFPNPSDGKTTISLELPENVYSVNTLIKIYNSSGDMIRILPVDISSKQNKYSVEWDGKYYDDAVFSGIYYCNLEIDGRKIATNKLIITK